MKKKFEKELEDNLVWQDNKLIEAFYSLGLNEQKFVLAIISKICPTHGDFHPYKMTAPEFQKLLKLKQISTAYRDMKKISKSVLKQPITIDESDGPLQCNFFSSCKYYEKKGYADVTYDPKLKPYLIQVKKNFTAYSLGYILELTSVYSIRLYQLLKQFQKAGVRSVPLKLLRKLIGLKPGKYKRYNHFKQKILEFALHEINLHTDIKFTYEEIKEINKVVEIIFTISKNEKNIKKRQKKEAANTTAKNQASETTEQADQTEKTDYEKIYALIPVPDNRYKTLPKVINPHLKTQGYQYVKENVMYVVNQSPSRFMGYLKQALKENYTKFGKAKPDPKIAEAKAKYKECQVAKTHATCPAIWSDNNLKTKPCYYCYRFKDHRLAQEELEMQAASKPNETIKAKPTPEVKPEPQKVAAQAPPVEPQPQELSEVEQVKLQMQEMQKQMMEQMQEIQQLKAEKSAPAPEPIGATKVEDVKVGPDDFNDRQPPPSTLADNRLIAKWWIIREAVKEKIGAGPHDINLYPLILDYNRSDENKLTLLAPHGFSKNSVMKKGYLTMIQEAAGNIEIMLEVAPPKKSGFYNQPEHATA